MNKLHNKDFSIAFKTGTDANKSKFKKECVQGEIYHATDTGFFYVAEVTAGASDATLSKFGFSNIYSVDFDGTDDFMATGSPFESTFQSDHSVSFWAKDASGNQVFAGNLGSTRYYYQTNSGVARIVYYTGTGTIITNIGTIVHGTDWFHCVGTIEQDASNIVTKLYINGTLDNTVTTAGTMSSYTSSLDWEIGKRHRPGNTELNFSGNLDEFAIIPSALSASDVTAIYNSGVPADISSYSPVAWYRMGDNDGGTGTTITDQGSGGNDGTLTNGATFSTSVPS